MVEFRLNGRVYSDGWAALQDAERAARERGKPAYVEARPPGFTFFYLYRVVTP